MKDFFKLVGYGLVVILFITIMGIGIQGSNFFLYRMFAPAMADAQREVFRNSDSHVQGTINELQDYQFKYIQADDSAKAAMAPIIIKRALDVREDLLPNDTKAFIRELKNKYGYR